MSFVTRRALSTLIPPKARFRNLKFAVLRSMLLLTLDSTGCIAEGMDILTLDSSTPLPELRKFRARLVVKNGIQGNLDRARAGQTEGIPMEGDLEKLGYDSYFISAADRELGSGNRRRS